MPVTMTMTMTQLITIKINDIQFDIAKGASVAQAIAVFNATNTNDANLNSFVIALNQNFVPRSQYDTIILQTNDVIELLSPMAGG